MSYAKLIDGALHYAPHTVTKDRTHYNPYPEALLIEDSYKPVTMTPMPDPVEGYIWVSGWEETEDAIVRTWTKEESPEPEPSAEEALETLIGIIDGEVE